MNGSTKAWKRRQRQKQELAAWSGYGERANPSREATRFGGMTVSLTDPKPEDMREARKAWLAGTEGSLPWYKRLGTLLLQQHRADRARALAVKERGWTPASRDVSAPSIRPAIHGSGSGKPVSRTYGALNPDLRKRLNPAFPSA